MTECREKLYQEGKPAPWKTIMITLNLNLNLGLLVGQIDGLQISLQKLGFTKSQLSIAAQRAISE